MSRGWSDATLRGSGKFGTLSFFSRTQVRSKPAVLPLDLAAWLSPQHRPLHRQ